MVDNFPIRFTWDWVEPGAVMASSMPNSEENLRILQGQGIRAIVSLNRRSLYCRPTIHPQVLLDLDMLHLHEPMPDGGVPDEDQIRRLITFMFRMRAEGRPFVVNCRGGIGRTGTVLWLYYRALGRKTSDILHMLWNARERDGNHPGPMTDEQCAMVGGCMTPQGAYQPMPRPAAAPKPPSVPEAYWISQGKAVIGTDVLELKGATRQAETYQMIARWIARQKVRSVLDVGCNVAALSLFLKEAAYRGEYLGVDPNPNALAIAVAPVQAGNLRNLDFLDGTFEAVVVKDVIEHLESYGPLREAFRVAERYVIVATYLPWSVEEQIAVTDQHYTNVYRYADIIRLAEECGFEFIEDSYPQETNGTVNLVTCWRRREAKA